MTQGQKKNCEADDLCVHCKDTIINRWKCDITSSKLNFLNKDKFLKIHSFYLF